ncbi:hypothetical protein [Methanosphaera sp.]|jgi:bifunctional DNA-binding transcriptional regulator/antitoxin component of YhaV-PrlF toxin-antitoxin module|uniref:hypothetical protein n=1 Tax=Methanosphaera sp. TaxID=2666342 RepID=UPI003D94BD13
MTEIKKIMKILPTGKNNNSIRITIPEVIKDLWDLKPKDEVEFLITIENNKVKVELKPVK